MWLEKVVTILELSTHAEPIIAFLSPNVTGQLHEERNKVKINKYVFFHCKLIALTQTFLHVLGKNIFILGLLANLFS